jgi:4-hydroxy-tetrahydrodipicolinate reductase
VDAIWVGRVQDASTRREPVQATVGAGLDTETDDREIHGGEGHVGLAERVAMLAATLGWELRDVTESAEPVVAEEPVETDSVRSEPGEVAGTAQRGVGRVAGDARIELEMGQDVGAPEPRDEIRITGEPALEMTIPGGIGGDTAIPAVGLDSACHVASRASRARSTGSYGESHSPLPTTSLRRVGTVVPARVRWRRGS